MKTRQHFRNPESYEAERITRGAIAGFLRRRGFQNVKDERKGQSQKVLATSPSGDELVMRVRLCWRRQSGSRDSERVKKYSAAQLLAKVKDSDWEGSLAAKVERERSQGITHFLFVQGEDQSIKYAALMPLSELLPIWCAQRDISKELIESGQLGRRKKNHAMNGSSPTIWLQDDQALQIGAALWQHPGVQDLAKLTPNVSILLPDEEADSSTVDSTHEEQYSPLEGDRRDIVERQIRERRGQQRFRNALRGAYGDRCLITGCKILAVLEAAHVKQYRGEHDNHVENGLLLRADIHTLFDLDLIGVEPEQLSVSLHPSVVCEYADLEGKVLDCPNDVRPSREALRLRYQQFQERKNQQ